MLYRVNQTRHQGAKHPKSSAPAQATSQNTSFVVPAHLTPAATTPASPGADSGSTKYGNDCNMEGDAGFTGIESSGPRVREWASDVGTLYERAARQADRTIEGLGVPTVAGLDRRPSSSPPDHPSSAQGSSPDPAARSNPSPDEGKASDLAAPSEERSNPLASQISALGAVPYSHSLGTQSSHHQSQALTPAHPSPSHMQGESESVPGEGSEYAYHTPLYIPPYISCSPATDSCHLAGVISPSPPSHSLGAQQHQIYPQDSIPHIGYFDPGTLSQYHAPALTRTGHASGLPFAPPMSTMYSARTPQTYPDFSINSTQQHVAPWPDQRGCYVPPTSAAGLAYQSYPSSSPYPCSNESISPYAQGSMSYSNRAEQSLIQNQVRNAFFDGPPPPFGDSSAGVARCTYPQCALPTTHTAAQVQQSSSICGYGCAGMQLTGLSGRGDLTQHGRAGIPNSPSEVVAGVALQPPLSYRSQTHEQKRGIFANQFRDSTSYREMGMPTPTPEKEWRPTDMRRHGLPRPPTHSDYALWVGNIPNDATHEELWRFFATQPPPDLAPLHCTASSGSRDNATGIAVLPNPAGVDSIHLISRSNCAFINYNSQNHLDHAIARSHGQSLRPLDLRCKPMVCRIRKKDDNIKSGVGAQRVGGMHRQWIEQQQRRAVESALTSASPRNRPTGPTPVSPPGVEGSNLFSAGASATASTSSTTSSFLTHYFPRRFFILKSHTEDDLKLSVEKSTWASQAHNEPVLDRAYRTCPEGVFLIFSANRSGEFFGYARMAGPITREEMHVPKASRILSGEDSPEPGSVTSALAYRRSLSLNSATARSVPQKPEISPASGRRSLAAHTHWGVLSPSEGRMTNSSPKPLTPASIPPTGERGRGAAECVNDVRTCLSEPNPFIKPVHSLSIPAQKAETWEPRQLPQNIVTPGSTEELTAVSHRQECLPPPNGLEDGAIRSDDAMTPEQRHAKLEASVEDATPARGHSFPIQWLSVTKLAFHRTREFKNPFNGFREVKISRDGTEVEPSVGEELLAAFAEAEAASQETSAVDAQGLGPGLE